MPVEFLTDEQATAYGTFGEVPTRPELERFFFLDDDDRDLIALRRSDGHRLGMALQICTVRYIGTFLGDDPLAVPWEVVDYLAGQLGIEDASCVKSYAERRMTPYNHAQEIRERFGYHDYGDRKWSREFRTFLYGRAWTHAEGPVALFNHAVTWLRRHRVLLPGSRCWPGRCRRPARWRSGGCMSRWPRPRTRRTGRGRPASASPKALVARGGWSGYGNGSSANT